MGGQRRVRPATRRGACGAGRSCESVSSTTVRASAISDVRGVRRCRGPPRRRVREHTQARCCRGLRRRSHSQIPMEVVPVGDFVRRGRRRRGCIRAMAAPAPVQFYTGLYGPRRSETPDPAPDAAFVRRFGQPALELGCGDGDPVLALVADGSAVDGLDSSSAMLDRCRRAAAARGLGVTLHHQTMETMDLSTTYRPIYLAGATFTLLPDDAAAERALRRIAVHLHVDGAALTPPFIPAPTRRARWELTGNTLPPTARCCASPSPGNTATSRSANNARRCGRRGRRSAAGGPRCSVVDDDGGRRCAACVRCSSPYGATSAAAPKGFRPPCARSWLVGPGSLVADWCQRCAQLAIRST